MDEEESAVRRTGTKYQGTQVLVLDGVVPGSSGYCRSRAGSDGDNLNSVPWMDKKLQQAEVSRRIELLPRMR